MPSNSGKGRPEGQQSPQRSRKNGGEKNGNGRTTESYTRDSRQTQGQKRFRNGRLKHPNTESETKIGTITSKPRKRPDVGTKVDEADQLEEAVLAFGGTQDDIELVGGAASDSEFDGDNDRSRTATDFNPREVTGLIRQLGLDKIGQTPRTDEDTENGIESDGPKEKSKAYVEGPIPTSAARRKDKVHGVNSNEATIQSKSKLALPVQAEWHSVELPSIPLPLDSSGSLRPSFIEIVQEHAKTLLERENSRYVANRNTASSAHQFYSTIMNNGTLSDKISALTLSIQESPLHNMKALESLIGLGRKRSRDQAVNVLGALKDLFGAGNLLPSDRRLVQFGSQPVMRAAFGNLDQYSWTPELPLPAPISESHLISWAFEDWLKSSYFQVLQILETWCSDEVTFARIKAIEYVSQLLREKPEQEANLLRLLVNKLGDSEKKVASKTSYHILQVENTHPLMKPTIISSIESDLLFRPGQSLHAQYYAVITLNQTVLSAKAEDVTQMLLSIYFSVFTKLLAKADHTAESKESASAIHINKKGQIQGGGGKMGKKALQKQKEKERSSATDDDLREKLLSAVLTGVNRAVPYLSANDGFLEKHLDTLYQVTHSANFNTGIQALMLIQQVTNIQIGLQDRFYRVLYESLLDPRLLLSSKQALYLNMLYRALKSDLNVNRVQSFMKRLVQTITIHQPPFCCGVLFMLRELEKVFPTLSLVSREGGDGFSDEEELFRDVTEDPSPFEKLDNGSSGTDLKPAQRVSKRSKYDPRKRDPLHAMAASAPFWELSPLTQHYHPSAALFSNRLLSDEAMPPVPDLQQNTLIHFLDRFVFKNPKTSHVDKVKGISIMQPLAASDDSSVLLSSYSAMSRREQPVTSETFWRRDSGKVSPEDAFFHQYFSNVNISKEKAKQKRGKKEKSRERDGISEEESEEEEEIWKALVDSKPEIEEDEDEGDVDFDDDEASDFDPDMMEGSDDEDLESTGEAGDEDLEALMFDSESSDSGGVGSQIGEFGKFPVTSPLAPPVEGKKGRRRDLKGLPTFADAEQYASMLKDDEG